MKSIKKYYLYRGSKHDPYEVFPYHDLIPRWREDNPTAEYIGPFTMASFPTFKDALSIKLSRVRMWWWKRTNKL